MTCEQWQHSPGFINLNLWYLNQQHGASVPRVEVLDEFEKIEELKHGCLLLRCKDCRRGWFFDARSFHLRQTNETESALLRDWAARDLAPTGPMLKTLNTIGDLYLRTKDTSPENSSRITLRQEIVNRFGVIRWWPEDATQIRSIPCRAILKNGERCDPAVVMFNVPPDIGPLQELYSKTIFIDDVQLIEPTPYLLPFAVRQVALSGKQVKGFGAMLLEGPSHRQYIVDAYESFFESEGDVGSQMRIVSNDAEDIMRQAQEKEFGHNREFKTTAILADLDISVV